MRPYQCAPPAPTPAKLNSGEDLRALPARTVFPSVICGEQASVRHEEFRSCGARVTIFYESATLPL
jgi:hypothetical protein